MRVTSILTESQYELFLGILEAYAVRSSNSRVIKLVSAPNCGPHEIEYKGKIFTLRDCSITIPGSTLHGYGKPIYKLRDASTKEIRGMIKTMIEESYVFDSAIIAMGFGADQEMVESWRSICHRLLDDLQDEANYWRFVVELGAPIALVFLLVYLSAL